jgi:hypothetical protein
MGLRGLLQGELYLNIIIIIIIIIIITNSMEHTSPREVSSSILKLCLFKDALIILQVFDTST